MRARSGDSGARCGTCAQYLHLWRPQPAPHRHSGACADDLGCGPRASVRGCAPRSVCCTRQPRNRFLVRRTHACRPGHHRVTHLPQMTPRRSLPVAAALGIFLAGAAGVSAATCGDGEEWTVSPGSKYECCCSSCTHIEYGTIGGTPAAIALVSPREAKCSLVQRRMRSSVLPIRHERLYDYSWLHHVR